MATATRELAPPTSRTHPATVIAAAVGSALAVNLVIYAIGRLSGGTFAYTHGAKPNRVDVASVILMSGAPAAIGLAAVAWLSRRWAWLTVAAQIAIPVLAIGTIGAMTLPAGFDATSAVALSAMHLALVPATLLAVGALARQR